MDQVRQTREQDEKDKTNIETMSETWNTQIKPNHKAFSKLFSHYAAIRKNNAKILSNVEISELMEWKG